MLGEQRFLSGLGTHLRDLRERAGLSVSDLAQRSGLSRRYLTEAEAGRGNLSILKLAGIAQGLRIPLAEICDVPLPRGSRRRIALVGLRGAGKSTIGRRLAMGLEVPFVELDRLIEERSSLSLEEIFSLHGEDFYRRLEREALEHHLERSGEGVLATGGSLVTHPETWDRLRETCFTVWLKAAPEDHWNRVINQGDTRPMARNPRAMDELRDLLAARDVLYDQADLVVDTSDLGIEEAVGRITELAG